MRGVRSRPIAVAPRAEAAKARSPVPQARSRTRSPGAIAAVAIRRRFHC